MADPLTFDTVLWGNASNAGIPVPREVVAALGRGGRPRLVVNVNGFEFTRELGSMGGEPMIGFSRARRRASGISPGDPITVSFSPAVPEPPSV